MPALTVFALSIQFQKEDVLNALHSSDLKTDDTEILWVVTAWNDSDIVKQFMRAAAIQVNYMGYFQIVNFLITRFVPKIRGQVLKRFFKRNVDLRIANLLNVSNYILLRS